MTAARGPRDDITPFGARWESLDLGHLRAFFADAGDEGLTWEAKGTKVARSDILEGVCGFGNSDLGGFLVLGASRAQRGDPWTLDGWEPPDEPSVWIENVLGHGGVNPLPSHVAKSWPLPAGRQVTVVNVRSAPDPPCVTSNGHVWQRLDGKTERVTDSAALRRLFERGESALMRAQIEATQARGELAAHPSFGRKWLVVVAMASPSLASDVSAAVFLESTYQLAEARLPGRTPAFRRLGRLGGEVSQGGITAWNREPGAAETGSAIRVRRHGGVAVARTAEADSGLALVAAYPEQELRGLWDSAVAVLQQLGAYGRMHVAIWLSDASRGPTEIARWAWLDEPSADVIASIGREARRTLGDASWEPPTDDAGSNRSIE